MEIKSSGHHSKDEHITYFERMVGDLKDELFRGLKKLTVAEIKLLHKVVADRIAELSKD